LFSITAETGSLLYFDEVDAPLDDANIDKFNTISAASARTPVCIVTTTNDDDDY